ncbi:hypothetical protein Ahy_A07g032767 [Arachis hypogaea]|uniref:Ubiquitin-like protease family profile domain-containing protein n=1 Tax=Arachis hypogaea TaxID=3818 RepID=A0A445C7Q6_ARAHY|nr:hypothetical protein Ahy_A07g032767 [Arachis hypogaea]
MADQIYCPIWCENHWFLVVVDVVRRQVVYLDSLKSADTRAKRRREIKKVTTFLEELLDHDRWYDAPEKGRELVSDYEIIEPVVVQQDPYSQMGSFRLSSFIGELICGSVSLHYSAHASNDCGMFVAQWMIMYHLWGNYDVEKVTDYSRMRLAVDMLLRYHNDNREKIVNAALEYWRNFDWVSVEINVTYLDAAYAHEPKLMLKRFIRILDLIKGLVKQKIQQNPYQTTPNAFPSEQVGNPGTQTNQMSTFTLGTNKQFMKHHNLCLTMRYSI